MIVVVGCENTIVMGERVRWVGCLATFETSRDFPLTSFLELSQYEA